MILDGDAIGDVDADKELVVSDVWGIVQRRTMGGAVCGVAVPTKGRRT